jgi:hypothetical protein
MARRAYLRAINSTVAQLQSGGNLQDMNQSPGTYALRRFGDLIGHSRELCREAETAKAKAVARRMIHGIVGWNVANGTLFGLSGSPIAITSS